MIFKSIKIVRILFVGLFLMAAGTILHSQNVSAKASLDSTVIVIGGQVGLRLEVAVPQGMRVAFPALADTVTSKIDVVSELKTDTVIVNGLLTLKRDYLITSFDSGLHYIPPFKFEYAGNDGSGSVESASLALNVVNPFESVDPQKGITDIKPPFNLPFTLRELLKYLPYVLAALLVFAIIVFGVLYYLRRKGKIAPFIAPKPKEPAHVIALRELERIKSEKKWQHNRVKEFYSELTDTLRKYIEDRFGIQAMEFTSDQTLDALRQQGFSDKKNLDQLSTILNLADLVKFARYEPLPDENDLMVIHALFFVNQTKAEEMKSLEEQKEEFLKQTSEQEK